ncbi:erythromycin esterase family protein [Arcticibacter svalbardensis]|uniref:erythromycin esterase family protein n=1 Tax=Arcticibacter svalbardensis TaxID=1288027 RepID=UPI001360B176|nr:erythromycin esterase family protein [Arcticibacter svalbardensis]
MLRFLAITILISSTNVCYTFGQSVAEQIVGLSEHIIPLKGDIADFEISEYQKLGPSIADKQVIALGEATHGTREFFLYKAGLCRYLIEVLGMKTIIMESDFAGTQQINDFVVNGKGSAELSIWQMGFSGTTQEFIDFVNWVRAYNKNKSAIDKVVFYGCDMQYPSYAANTIKDYLVKRKMINPELSKGFETMNKFLPSLTKDDKVMIRKIVSSLASVDFADQDPNTRSLYRHDVRVLEQFVDYMDAQSSLFPAKQSDLRDKFMAENCKWIYDYNKKGKTVIWAHNEHIKKSKGSDGFIRMGISLAEVFKDDYYAICLDFYKGTMRSFDIKLKKNIPVELPPGKVGSSGEVFSRCNVPTFFLDFKTAETSMGVYKFLNAKIPSVFYGGHFDTGQPVHYVNNKLGDAYDAVVFFTQTTAASNIKKSE